MNPKKQAGPKKGQGLKSVRPRSRADTASPVGGRARKRKGGAMRPISRPSLSIPQREEMNSEGYRFPSDPATPAQEKALAGIVTGYLRRDFLNRHQQLPAETLAGAIGMKERAAASLLSEVRKGRFSPASDLVVNVLHGILSGKIAGILGTRRDGTTRWLFKLVNDYDLSEYDMRFRLYVDDAGDCVKDASEYRSNCSSFRKFHAAFKLEYMLWLRRK